MRALEHLAAGLLSRAEVRRRIVARWESFNRSGLALSEEPLSWELDFYDRLLEPGQRVLVIGCGSGRDVLALLARGARVTGFDITPQAVAVASRRVSQAGHTASLLVAAVEDRPALPGPCDWAIFSFYCYDYIVGAQARIEALNYVRENLSPGGRVLLSYMPRRPGTRYRVARLAGRLAAWSGNDWAPGPGDTLTLFWLEDGTAAVSLEHYFEPAEVLEEVVRAGFRVVSHETRDGAGILTAEAL